MTAGPTPGLRAALRNPSFGKLLGAQAVSGAGDWLYNVALLALVWDRTHSTGWLTATTIARVAPMVVLGPLGGLLAQRLDRRRLMIASDVVRLATMVALAVVALAGLPVWMAPLLAGVATAAAAPYPTAVAATVPRLVADADLPAANAARAVVGPACIVIGPALGAALLLVASPALAILLNGLTFLASAVAVASISPGPVFAPCARTEESLQGVLAELREGAAALLEHRAALRLVGADVCCSLVYGAQTVLLVPVAHRLGLSGGGFGTLFAALGVGAVLGGTLSGRVAAHGRPAPLVSSALLVVALTLPLTGLLRGLLPVLVLVALSGAACMLVEVLAETALQRSLPDEVFARAYGFAFPASISGIVAGSGLAALFGAWFGVAGALTAVAALVVLASVWVLRPLPQPSAPEPAVPELVGAC